MEKEDKGYQLAFQVSPENSTKCLHTVNNQQGKMLCLKKKDTNAVFVKQLLRLQDIIDLLLLNLVERKIYCFARNAETK